MRRRDCLIAGVSLAACGKSRLELVRDVVVDAGAAPFGDGGAGVALSVDWSSFTGSVARKEHFGLALVRGSDPQVAGGREGEEAYHAGLASMRPGLVRITHQDLLDDSTTRGAGWVIDPAGPGYRWDRAKMSRALTGAYAFTPTRMITLGGWPAALGPADRPLDPARHDAFAAFAADLVRALNVEQRHGVEAFEILSEPERAYPNQGEEVGRLVRKVALAMKAVDPNVRVGGCGFIQAFRPEIAGFLAAAGDVVDFVSYRGYGTGAENTTTSDVFRNALGFAEGAAAVRAAVKGATDRPVQVMLTQWSLSWRADARMHDAGGAVFDALALQTLASAVDAATSWNDSDGWYGKLDGSFRARPSAHLLAVFNRHMTGRIVRTSTVDPIAAMAVVDGGRHALSLVNPGDAAVAIAAEVGATFAGGGRVVRVDDAGATELGRPVVRGGRLEVMLPGVSVTVVSE